MKTASGMIDQFSFRMTAAMTAATDAARKYSLILFWLPEPPFLNFIENIGISLTSSVQSVTEAKGMKYLVAAQDANVLVGSLLT